MSATQDYVALDWIKGEITQTLERAQYALEAVAESPDDSSSMRSCLTAIHQAHGTLQMVELEGPTRIAGEMEDLAQALMNGAVPDEARAQEILMQIILQMPGYLDRIQREQKDSPGFVIPAINNLRIARGEAKLEGSADDVQSGPNPLFVAEPGPEVRSAFEKQKGTQNSRKIRQRYQQALIALLKKEKPRENLNLMGKAFAMLVKMCGVSAKGNLFRVALAVVEGISAGGIRLDSKSADKFKRVDAELKDLATRGVDSLGEVSAELGAELLSLVHEAKIETPRIAAVKSLFADETVTLLDTEDINFGPDDETLSTVSKIIIEELHSVTDKLDLFVRSSDQDPSEIYELTPSLEQIASTLTVVGMVDHQASILSQIKIIKQLESEAVTPGDDELLEMARAFLEIESSLSLAIGEGEDGTQGDSFGDLNEAMASVIRETRHTLAISKDQVIDFISSDFELAKIQLVPTSLRSLGGGLSVINQQRSCDILNAAADYIQTELIDHQSRPELSQMDDLADAITSIDYYLERLLESASDPYLQMVDVAEAAVAKLGYAVDRVPVVEQIVEQVVDDPIAEPLAEPEDEPTEGSLEETAEGSLEEPAEGSIEEPAEGSIEEPAEGSIEEPAEGSLEELAEGSLEETAEGSIEETAEGSLEETAEGSIEELAEGSLEETAEGSLEETAEGSIEELAEGSYQEGGEGVEFDASSQLLDEVLPEEVLPEAEALAQVAASEVPTEIEASEIVSEPAPIAGAGTDLEDPVHDEDLIDDEILEIFIEEAGEVLENIQTYLPGWKANPADIESLTEVRRAFHTLKGSGRMVGATVMGEFAWSVENMLNRVMDNTIVADADLFNVLDDVVVRIPEGIESFKQGRQTEFHVEELVAKIESIANGEQLQEAAPSMPLAEEIEPGDLEIVELEVEVEESVLDSLAPDIGQHDIVSIASEEDFTLEELDEDDLAPVLDNEIEEPDLEDVPAQEPELADIENVEVEEVELELVEMEPLEAEQPDSSGIENLGSEAFTDELDQVESDDGLDEFPDATSTVEESAIETEIELEEVEFGIETVAEEVSPEPVDDSLEEPADDSLEEPVDDSLEELAEDSLEETADDSLEEPAEDSLEETADGALEETADGALEEPADGSLEEPVDDALEELADGSLEELADGSLEELADGSLEELADDALEELADDALEETADGSLEELAEGSLEELAEGSLEELAEGSLEEPAEDSLEETADGALEETADGALEEPADGALEEPADGALEEPADGALLETADDFDNELAASGFDLDELSLDVLKVEPVAEDVEPEWDPELDEIFVAEANEKIALIKQYVSSPGTVTPDVIAAFHTLKGSAGMAGVTTIARIAAPMEKWSTDLFLGSSVPPDNFIRSVSHAIELMSQCLEDLASHRAEMPAVDEFLVHLDQSDDVAPAEGFKLFDFENIRVLSKPVEILEHWDTVEIGTIVSELEDAQAQAVELEQQPLEKLVAALLSTYGNLSSQPDAEILSLLISAHERLILMFDSLAASQEVNADPDIVLALESIDFAALELARERLEFVTECRELLVQLDGMLHIWAQDINNEMPLIQLRHTFEDLAVKVERPDCREMAVMIEPMVQFCELVGKGELGANEDDHRLLESGRRNIELQLEAWQKNEPLVEDQALLGEFRNRLETSAISSQVLPNPETEALVEDAPDQTVPATIALPEDEIDLDILAIFLEEAEELIEGTDQSILDWSDNPANFSHLDNILRFLHTMKGGSRLAGLNSLGEYTHNFETDLISLQTNPRELDDEFFASVNERQDEITRRIAIYARYAEGAATEAEMAAMQQAKVTVIGERADSTSIAPDRGPSTQAPVPELVELEGTELSQIDLPEDDVDMEILSIFIEEAEELLESIDQSILEWSGKATDQTYLDNLLRHLHTLKGGARLAGLNSLGEYAHNLETFLIGVQQNPVNLDDEFFALLNQHQDEITRRVAIYRKMSAGSAEADELSSLNSGVELPVNVPGAASATPGEPGVSQDDSSANQAGQQAPRTGGATQEMVRVSADLLDELVSLAGETSITRGRIEQQISDFGESLEEMEETIVRIREQVRRLEIEAESRETVFRSQSKDGDAGFDELEMDRYTMLQEISRSLSEGSSDMMDLKDTLLDKSRDAETLLHQQARLGSELQEGLTRTRMVPFARLIPRLRRIVRQISSEVGKSVRFDAFNVEGELDRNVLERIVAPLEHMLRNAVDHGIESKEDRIRENKPETGRISLRLSREGGYVVLIVSDDGGGINVEAVKKKAIERGLIRADEQITDHEAMQFIMNAGFSTAQTLTQISGRGVGMDVVNSEIKQLGGSLSIDSTFGVGTEFSIRIPFTVSINRALMVVIQEETYAVPLNTIEGIVRVSPYELEAYYQPDAPMFEYAGQPYRLTYMGKLLSRSEDPALEGQTAPLPVILARSGDLSVAIQVDKVIGSREVVVKTLGRQFDQVGGISGATVLGDGSVVVILDVLALVQRVDAEQQQLAMVESQPVDPGVKRVMIVDDSVTVRKVTTRLMERQGWEVTTAKDGLDAVEQLQDIYPDIVLLDIEMPKMDGFEVLRTVRRDERLKDLPIIMITSRTGEKHKQQAFDLGVNSYLGKPFQEAGLMSTIEEVLSQVKK